MHLQPANMQTSLFIHYVSDDAAGYITCKLHIHNRDGCRFRNSPIYYTAASKAENDTNDTLLPQKLQLPVTASASAAVSTARPPPPPPPLLLLPLLLLLLPQPLLLLLLLLLDSALLPLLDIDRLSGVAGAGRLLLLLLLLLLPETCPGGKAAAAAGCFLCQPWQTVAAPLTLQPAKARSQGHLSRRCKILGPSHLQRVQ